LSKSKKPKHRLDQPAKEDQELDFRDILKHLDRESAHFVVRLETHSGKLVTTVEPHRLIRDSIELTRLAHRLKESLGTGGDVEGGRIILHGDHRDKVGNELVKLGATVENIEII
jgi:translation initiation factor 1